MSEASQDHHQRLTELFAEAIELAPDAQRALIDRVRSDDAALAEELSSLLGADGKASDQGIRTGAFMPTLRGKAVNPDAAPRVPGYRVLGVLGEGGISATDMTVAAGQDVGTNKTRTAREALAPEPLGLVDASLYENRSLLSEGGMGRIFTAEDRRLHRRVALKELQVQRPDLLRRFEREALLTARLQHPSIVSIHEAGRWPSGEPFYAMKLVAGRSFDRVIVEAASLEARLALLPHVIAVADALAYAHNEGVIHRDLKPHNVMIGDYGETVVIDWGIAKDLRAQNAPEDTPRHERLPATEGETELGEVIGTPAYMPPEQANGDPVDMRADVYAIGAILYSVLAGAPPYQGALGPIIIDAVLRGPPEPLASRQKHVPPDLIAIVERAMARDAGARYPSARELSDDLRRFQTGQLVGAHRYSLRQRLGRWVRRNRAAVAVGGVAIAVLLAGGGVALRRIIRAEHTAEMHRQQAVASRSEAEDLLGFMLVDLRDKLRPVGRLDLLDAAAKKAMAYYDRQGDTLDDGQQARRATARQNLGDVLAAQGHTADALAQYRAALATFEVLAATAPTSADPQRDLAEGHEKVGTALRAQGDTAGALAEYEAALSVREVIAGRGATTDDDRELAADHGRVGHVLQARGDATGALAQARAALAILEQLHGSAPTNAKVEHDLAIAHDAVGDVLRAGGDETGELAQLRAELAILEVMSDKDAQNAELQRDLSICHDKLGHILRARDDTAGALAHYQAALAIRVALSAKDPTSADRQRDLSVGHANVGEGLLAQGDAAGALVEFRACLALREALAAKDPTNADRQRDLSIAHGKVGVALLAQSDPAGALAQFQASLAIREALAAKDATNTDRQRDLALAHEKVGEALSAKGDAASALAQYRIAQQIDEALLIRSPTNADAAGDLASEHAQIGDALAHHDAAQALAEYRAALVIVQRLTAKDPANATWKKQADDLARKIAAPQR